MPKKIEGKPKDRRMSILDVSTKTKYSVQHRSDLLLDEHKRNIVQVQYELQSTLQKLETCKSPNEIEGLRMEVANLKAQAEKQILSLQVMTKINTELSYARNDLNDSLHKGIGDINAARKRVIWLEDKMGELCGKKRLKTRRPSNRFVTDPTYRWDTDSDGETRRLRPLDSTERMYASDQARHQSLTQLLGSEIGYTSDSDHVTSRQVGFPDLSSQSYDSHDMSMPRNKGIESSLEDVSTDHATMPARMVDHRKSLHDSVASLTSGGQVDIQEESMSDKFSTVKEMSVVAASPAIPESSPDHSMVMFETEKLDEDGSCMSERMIQQELPSSNRTEDTNQEDQDLHTSQKAVVIHTGQLEEDEKYEDEEKEDDGEQEKEKEDYDDQCLERVYDDEKDDEEEGEEIRGGDVEKGAFITEMQQKPDTEAVRLSRLENAREPTPHRDLGTEYWESEHHRFEYNELSAVLTQMDPLSYHQMGLAVPGSFIKKEETQQDFDELPWRTRRKGSDVKDIHRIALDKLAVRVHNMYDKVYNAAMLSVRHKDQTGENLTKEMSSVQISDAHRGKVSPASSVTPSQTPQTAPASIRQKTEDMLPLASSKEVKRAGTFITGKLVFYPKPIPPPQVLPITRTSLNKEYPQFASSFAEPNPEKRAAAERLVDQHNLVEETKLVLYREKIKPTTPGPTRLERKFRKLLEKDRAHSNKSSGNKMKTSFKTAAVLSKFQGATSNWNQIKPQSRGSEYSGLRWERVKTIVHKSLPSERSEERRDAAKQLGLLRCGDTMVFYALKERLHNDHDDRVKYEAAKSLILNGCWEDEVLQVILKYFVLGNTEIRADLVNTLINGKNVQYVDKTIPSFLELVKVLSHFCRNPDPDDLIAFNSAVCLGRLCVRDDSAEARLVKAMEESSDTHIRAKALEILVKQLVCVNDHIVGNILELLQESPVWKLRALACRLLITLGPKNMYVKNSEERIYSLLEKKLWDDPNMDVRLAAAKALTALRMFAKACDSVEKKLEDADEDARSEAAISVGTLGMKSEKIIRLLLEMLELDSSDYVRLMIIRTFGILRLTDKRVLRCLREREKLDGPLARESKKSLRILDQVMLAQTSKSWPDRLLQNKPFSTKRLLSPIMVSSL